MLILVLIIDCNNYFLSSILDYKYHESQYFIDR